MIGCRGAHKFELPVLQFMGISFMGKIEVENFKKCQKLNYCSLWWDAIMTKHHCLFYDVAISVILIAENVFAKLPLAKSAK